MKVRVEVAVAIRKSTCSFTLLGFNTSKLTGRADLCYLERVFFGRSLGSYLYYYPTLYRPGGRASIDTGISNVYGYGCCIICFRPPFDVCLEWARLTSGIERCISPDRKALRYNCCMGVGIAIPMEIVRRSGQIGGTSS